MSQNKYTTTAVYTGRRLGTDGKVRQRFEKKNGEEMFFKGVRGVHLGWTYKCGASNISGRPERTDAQRIDNPEWESADALVDAKNARDRAERKIAESAKPAIKAALAALAPLCRGLDYFQREALIKYLAANLKIGRPGK